MHQRNTIRDAVVAALMGETDAGDRVLNSRFQDLRRRELPAVIVYTLSETVDAQWDEAPRRLRRLLQVSIEAGVEGEDEAAVVAALDDLAQQIERAMHADETLGGACSDSLLQSTDVAFDVNGAKVTGAVALNYEVEYFTEAPDAADQELDDFNTARIEYDVRGGAQDEEDRASDDLNNIHE